MSGAPPDSPRTKLRRARRFDGDAPIRSRLPDGDAPHSRVVTVAPRPADSAEYLDLRDGDDPLVLDDVVDRVLCGDAARVLRRLPDGFAACAVTSPPYWNLVDYGVEGQIGASSYNAYLDRLSEVWRELARALRPNGKLCVNVPLMPLRKAVSKKLFGPTHTRMLLDLHADIERRILTDTDLILYSVFIWEKQTTEKMFGSYPFPPNLYERNTIEFISVYVKPGAPPKLPQAVKEAARLSSEQWMELTKQIWWMYPENVRRKEGHPAPFPETLPNRLVNLYTFPAVASEGFEGDVVLDPFNGWGTTTVAARRCGRRFVGVDLSPTFCAEATKRLRATPLAPVVMPATRP